MKLWHKVHSLVRNKKKVPSPAIHTILVYYKIKYSFSHDPLMLFYLLKTPEKLYRYKCVRIYIYTHCYWWELYIIVESCEKFMPFKCILVNEDNVIFSTLKINELSMLRKVMKKF